LTKKIFDVHLMISNPDQYLKSFRKAGADSITVHYEACPHLVRTLQQIKELGASPAVSVNPHTPVSLLKDIFPYVEMILIMSVNPGFGGQKFIPQTINRVRELRNLLDISYPEVIIQIDGGVDLTIQTFLLIQRWVGVSQENERLAPTINKPTENVLLVL
jgi:ribulose-phosphate 3-epimerase